MTDTVYNVTYDLSLLKSTNGKSCTKELPDGSRIEFNICGVIQKSGNCATAGACLIRGTEDINIGEDGLLS